MLAAYFDALINIVSRKIRKKDYEEDELKYIYNTLEKIKTVKEMLTNDWKNCLWQANDDKAPEYISFKPLDIKDYSEELMLNTGQVRVFLSGTIGNIDIFCDELGLKKDAFIAIPTQTIRVRSTTPWITSLAPTGNFLTSISNGFIFGSCFIPALLSGWFIFFRS